MVSVDTIKPGNNSSPVVVSGPASLQEVSPDILSTESRNIGQKLSQKLVRSKSIYQGSQPVFRSTVDFVKKNTSRALWGIGFGTASLSVLSYFLIGSKILSFIFGIPTLMSFYIAHSIGNNIVKGKNNLFRNPLEQIKECISNPEKIDNENVQVLQSIDELKDLIDKKSDKVPEITDVLSRFKDLLKTKYEQIKETKDPLMSHIKVETERLLTALDFIGSSQDEELKSEEFDNS